MAGLPWPTVPPSPAAPVVVEPAVPADFDRIAALTVAVYAGGGFGSPDYVPQLADVAGRAAHSALLVARRPGGPVVGSVALVLDGHLGEVLHGPHEAGFRMLVVDPRARGIGVGELLVRTCLERATAAGRTRMVISTEPTMATAHRLYQKLGFTRLPERDWSPLPGVGLLVYSRPLP